MTRVLLLWRAMAVPDLGDDGDGVLQLGGGREPELGRWRQRGCRSSRGSG